MHEQNDKIDAFVKQSTQWKDLIQTLRPILLDCGLSEELKWNKPCYMYNGKNVAIIQPFKVHCALMFFKGAIFQDKHELLRRQGENTRSALRLEFTSKEQIKTPIISYYVKQAIEVEKNAGFTVNEKDKRELLLPDELTLILNQDSRVKNAFYALTPGRQRGYVIHITGAKQSKTRIARIERCIPKILAGKGMNDQ